jgi:uncharacterized protein (TIGR03435 family)
MHAGPLQSIAGFSSSGPRLTLEGYNRRLLIMEAYDLKSYQVSIPEAISQQDSYFDITAIAEGGGSPTKSEFKLMLQTLLAQRFDLKLHIEAKDMPVYDLVVGKGGPKFQESAPDAPETARHGVHGRNQTIAGPRETMAMLADDLQNGFIMGRPVVDKTGLTGIYNIQFEATPEFRAGRDPQAEDLSVFTAVQEQLGLKLEPSKESVRVLVVDQMDQPTEN